VDEVISYDPIIACSCKKSSGQIHFALLAACKAGRRDFKRLLVGENSHRATVLAPRRFIRTNDSRALFAVADGGDAVASNASTSKVFLGGSRAALTEGEVVFAGAALVAVAFKGHVNVRVLFQPCSLTIEGLLRFCVQGGAVEVEEHAVTDVLGQVFSAAGASGGTVGGTANGGPVRPGSAEDLTQNVGDRVFFETDSSSLTAESQQTLDRQAAWLKQYPNVNVTVEGHCDERGTREYNLALGERRAAASKKYLVGVGVTSNRISTISYGKERPAVIGSDESAWGQNRRSVTVLTNQ